MRLLVAGDLAGTGFGTVTTDLGRALIERGVDARFISMNEQPGETLPEPFTHRTATLGQSDGWLGLSHMAETAERLRGMFTGGLFEDVWAPEQVLVIGDMASLKMSPIPQLLPDGMPAWNYVPIEGINLPPRWTDIWRRIRPVAMSEFGADQIAALGLPRPTVVYHGVDTDVFYPVSDRRPIVLRKGSVMKVLRSKADCKRAFNLDPDRILCYRADRNMPRKNYPSLLRAMAPVLGQRPEVDLLWHCRTIDQGGDLSDERSKYRPEISARMISTGIHDQYGGAERVILNVLYNAADIYVSTSAEGFGLTIAEALACGVPAVAMAYSAVPEVVGKAGICVPVGGLVDNIYSHFWAVPDEAAFTKAVLWLVQSRAARREMGGRGPIHVGALFRWDRAAEQMEAIMSQSEAVAA